MQDPRVVGLAVFLVRDMLVLHGQQLRAGAGANNSIYIGLLTGRLQYPGRVQDLVRVAATLAAVDCNNIATFQKLPQAIRSAFYCLGRHSCCLTNGR